VVEQIRAQLPQELQSRAISLTRYKAAELIRQKVLVSAEPIVSLPKLPDELIQYINQFDERLHQAINQEPLLGINVSLEDYKYRLEASLGELAREQSISLVIEKLKKFIDSTENAILTANTKHEKGFFSSGLKLAHAKIEVTKKLIDYLKGGAAEELSQQDIELIKQSRAITLILGNHGINLEAIPQNPTQGGGR